MAARTDPRPEGNICRFGPFEADLRKCELRKFGIRVRLEPKPWHLLLGLLERPGEVVSRSELERRLWGEGVFVDFEHGLNVAVKKLREAVGDSADAPSYIETVAGEGYRFISPVELVPGGAPPAPEAEEAPAGAGAATAKQLPVRAVESIASRRYLWALAAALAVLAAGWGTFRAFHRSSPLLHSSGWILVANFENRTGERLFDGTIEYAVERELSNSQFVKVVPRERVEDALRMMKKPFDSKIDVRLGREICLRDGEIQALIAGRIEKLNASYVLSAEIVNPATGVRVASLSEEDRGDKQLAAAVRRLSTRVREAAGEDPRLIQQSNERLEKVTTPSLRALQLYTQADRVVAHTRDGDRQAVELLEQALMEDPNFASAHNLLGHAYANLSQNDKALSHFQRAFELADSTADREKFFILGSYYDRALHQLEKAAAAYEALLRLYPDHYWGNGNLMKLYARLGRTHEAAEHSAHIADLRPNDLHWNCLAADGLLREAMFGAGYTDAAARRESRGRAQIYIDRGLKLLQAEGPNASPGDADGLRLSVVQQDSLAGDLPKEHADLLLLERENTVLTADTLGQLFLAMGQLSKAADYFAGDNVSAAAVAFYRGDLPKARELLKSKQIEDPISFYLPACLMLRLGMFGEAEAMYRKLRAAYGDQSDSILTVGGQLALAKGETAKGIAWLERSRYVPTTTSTLGYEALADAYRKQGRPNDAVRVLEKVYALRAIGHLSEAFHMRLRLQLADLYRELGRISDAERVESELRKELTFADSDHPILLALARRGPG